MSSLNFPIAPARGRPPRTTPRGIAFRRGENQENKDPVTGGCRIGTSGQGANLGAANRRPPTLRRVPTLRKRMGGEVTGAKAPSGEVQVTCARGQGQGGLVERAGAERPSLGCCDAGLATSGVPETCALLYKRGEKMPTRSTFISRTSVPFGYGLPETITSPAE